MTIHVHALPVFPTRTASFAGASPRRFRTRPSIESGSVPGGADKLQASGIHFYLPDQAFRVFEPLSRPHVALPVPAGAFGTGNKVDLTLRLSPAPSADGAPLSCRCMAEEKSGSARPAPFRGAACSRLDRGRVVDRKRLWCWCSAGRPP